MTESDKTAATALLVRISGQLLVLTWLLVFALAVLASLLCAVSILAAGIAAAAVLVLAAGGLSAARAVARLTGLGYCGFWDHGAAARVLYRQSVVLIVAALLAALAVWIA